MIDPNLPEPLLLMLVFQAILLIDRMMREMNINESRVHEVPFSSEAIKDAIENAVALEERCDCALRGS